MSALSALPVQLPGCNFDYFSPDSQFYYKGDFITNLIDRPTTNQWTEWTTQSRPTQSGTSPVSLPRPGTACNTGQYIADPVNCGNYFRCVLGELKREQCAPGLHWDDPRKRCDWPATAKCQQGKLLTKRKYKSPVEVTPQISTLFTRSDFNNLEIYFINIECTYCSHVFDYKR